MFTDNPHMAVFYTLQSPPGIGLRLWGIALRVGFHADGLSVLAAFREWMRSPFWHTRIFLSSRKADR